MIYFILILIIANLSNQLQKCRIDLTNIQLNTQIIYKNILQLGKDSLPKQFSWNNVSNINYLTLTRNQNLPHACASCWAFAATSMLSDRIKIKRGASWPDINLSPQVLVSCNQENQGCQGGNSYLALQWIYHNNITDETCSQYLAQGNKEGQICNSSIRCRKCYKMKTCWSNPRAKIYTIQEFGIIKGEYQMMNEIFQRGPIVCGIQITKKLQNYKQGILNDRLNKFKRNLDHEVSIVGWGITKMKKKYWLVRNSWGTQWGMNGFFKILKGTNILGIESECYWGEPKDTWTQDIRNETFPFEQYSGNLTQHQHLLNIEKYQISVQEDSKISNNFQNQYDNLEANQNYNSLNNNISDIKHNRVYIIDQPKEWDWRSINGINYLTWSVNQHIGPKWCGSCFAAACASALQDRLNILRKNQWPLIILSYQFILNCKVGLCSEGKSPFSVFKFIKKQGLPEESCQPYIGYHPEGDCSPLNQCKICYTDQINNQEQCKPIPHRRWFVQSFGKIKQYSVSSMKQEIYENGPIVCHIKNTDQFLQYQGGIFQQKIYINQRLPHIISVVGWGFDKKNNIEYWIGRNSQGTFWGEQGYFRIRMYQYNLQIERKCYFAIPNIFPKYKKNN